MVAARLPEQSIRLRLSIQLSCKGDSACVAMALYFLSHSFIPSRSFLFFASNRLEAASVRLSWIDNSDNEDGFYIARKVGNNGIFSVVATVSSDVTFYTGASLCWL